MMNNEMTKSNEQNILVGIDVGSTTTKIVAVDANDRHQLLFSDYARHHANQIASVIKSIKEFCRNDDGYKVLKKLDESSLMSSSDAERKNQRVCTQAHTLVSVDACIVK